MDEKTIELMRDLLELSKRQGERIDMLTQRIEIMGERLGELEACHLEGLSKRIKLEMPWEQKNG